jgi:lipopolysaccharide/colanic/teichoic acid biosynthesis glycosyltransferase
MRINRSAMALQAVYTNLIGLALLLSLSPVLLVTAILVAMAARRAPLESIECPGFQRIPFYLLRFRSRRLDGELSWAGRALNQLHLVNLPQLINVVRGEMALFGPPPVRKEFAGRLGQLLAAYPHRFAVKPGIIGWSQANLQHPSSSGPLPDESLRLGYDLYYAKQESPSLDLDIFLRTVFRMPVPADRVPTPGGQTAVGA